MAPEGQPLAPPTRWTLTPRKVGSATLQMARLVEVMRSVLVWLAGALAVLLAWHRRDWIAAHPRIASLAFFIALALVHTWPLASDLAHLTRHDNRDAMLNEWIVAWVAHQLPRAPLHLFDANIFYPERYTLAYSEPMIVQGIMAMPLLWIGASDRPGVQRSAGRRLRPERLDDDAGRSALDRRLDCGSGRRLDIRLQRALAVAHSSSAGTASRVPAARAVRIRPGARGTDDAERPEAGCLVRPPVVDVGLPPGHHRIRAHRLGDRAPAGPEAAPAVHAPVARRRRRRQVWLSSRRFSCRTGT